MRVQRAGKEETLFKAEELEEVLLDAVNSRAFNFEKGLRIDEKVQGEWRPLENGSVKFFSPSAAKT
ncbi:MAG: hypothetical protein ACLFTA_00475 [Candidatus Nanohaloarchaea archaeon]